MAKFSDRIGATEPRRHLQIDDMDEPLRNALWNWLCWALEKTPQRADTWREQYWYAAAKGGLWDEVFHRPEDEVKLHHVQSDVKTWFMQVRWFDVYNLVEFILPRVNRFRDQYDRVENPEGVLNQYLEREMSGFRAIKGQLVPVTSPVEIDAINSAATTKSGFQGVAAHIETALSLLGKKPEPDYRNSIKESISAVEAAVKLLTGEKSGGIDKALAVLERRNALHPSFKSALSKLYGYTSDQGGIRHPILEEATTSGFAEAKFMLVACSAFVNFLIESAP